MPNATQILNNPELLEAFVAGSTWSRDQVISTLKASAEKEAAEAESAKQCALAEYPDLLKRSREERDRAANALEDAARALRHANALFFTLKTMVSCDELSLVEIGEEQASAYAERMQDEARYFAEGAQ
ncbi:hypothetical protein [Paraburkholderia tropica]|uniref:hypothetical protein n=1 Tax=Paraburkholderia tropica TaxID=92647 RepID=UPI002AB090D0|nr:hypothetical protein [Paraburkholderia tropica]